MPSFLYFHGAQLLFGLVYPLVLRQRFDWRFWRYQAAALLTVLLFYLPALDFSGVAAITSNEYVRPRQGGLAGYWPQFGPDLREFAYYCFSQAKLLGLMLSIPLALLPLALLRAPRQSVWFASGLLYAMVLLTLLGLMLGMRRSPNQRNLIGHCSLLLALAPVTLYWLLSQLPARWHPARWQAGALLVLLGVLMLKQVKANPVHKAENIYLFDNQTAYRALAATVQQLPADSRVQCGWNSFWVYETAQRRGLHPVLPCQELPAGTGPVFYALNGQEPLPADSAGRFVLWQRSGFERIYRRLR